MTIPPLTVVVLAAGEGRRMRSDTPKVLHPVGGEPMVGRVLDAANQLHPQSIDVVYGHAGGVVQSVVSEFYEDLPLRWVHQAEQLGTGHAVAQALPAVPDDHQVLVLCADVPLIRVETLRRLVEAAAGGVSVLTVEVNDPAGYGRILRNAAGQITGIVEEKDATEEQRAIREINTGVLCLPARHLCVWLDNLDVGNAQGEFYLTDCIGEARLSRVPVSSVVCSDPAEVQGVNDRAQLATVERAWQQRQAQTLMRDRGLSLSDPARFDLRGHLEVGRDCHIDVDVIIEGDVVLGDGVRIGPFCRIQDSHIAAGTELLGHCEIEDSHIGADCRIGPFARLRPGTRMAEGARIGNFVETKQTEIGAGSKINHLSYVGDAQLGADVNVGAGTITCNYDGRKKHRTRIGDGVFVGSNSALVAPLSIGNNAVIGAGTTVRDDVADDTLAVDDRRPRQIPGWRSGSPDE